MSYQVGQFRRNQLTTYQTQIETGAIIKNFATTVVDDLIVYNSAVTLKKDSSSLEKNKIYYIRFKTNNSNMVPFRLVLTNSEGTKKMVIKRITPVSYQEYEAIVMPNSEDYNTLVFERIRATAADSTGQYYSVGISEVSLYELANAMPPGVSKIHQLGLQGPPGLLFSVNGEELRIGKSGIYELKDITVTKLGFVIKNTSPIPFADGKDYFILDYYY